MSRANAALPASTSVGRTTAALVLFGALGAAAFACGGAEAPASSPKSPAAEPESTREPSSVEEAEEQIARARTALGDASSRRATSDAPGADAKKEPSASTPSAGSSTGTQNAPAGDAKPTDVCGGSCRALASMRRAVNALCRMTGDTDARCGDARRTLAESESRVATCRCAS